MSRNPLDFVFDGFKKNNNKKNRKHRSFFLHFISRDVAPSADWFIFELGKFSGTFLSFGTVKAL